MNRWAKYNVCMIVFLVVLSIVIVTIKRDSPNWWTGLYGLGLLPVVVADLRNELKK